MSGSSRPEAGRTPEAALVDPKVCEQCSRQGVTCCQSSDSGLEMRFPLSPSEIEMLRPFAVRTPALYEKAGKLSVQLSSPLSSKSSGYATEQPPALPEGCPPDGPLDSRAGGQTNNREEDWFYARVINTKYFVDSLCVLFPGEGPEIRRLYPVGHERFVLAVRKFEDGSQPANANCVFLEDSGCLLPREARPWHCRLFPLWSARGKPRLLDVETCLAVRQASALTKNNDKRLEEVLRMLHTDLNGFQNLHKGLRVAWGLTTGRP